MKTLHLCCLRFFLLLAMLVHVEAATPLTVRIQTTNQPPNSVRLDWNSQAGLNYQVLSTTNIDPFSLWFQASGTIPASGTNTTAVGSATNPTAFFKLHTLGQAGSGKPTISIISHTNGESVSGLTRIVVSAQDDSRITSVSLLVDGEPYEASISEGDLFWAVNTGHFSNGTHTVQAQVVDNAGNAELGGNPNSSIGGNSALSATVTLNFSNVVRWIDPGTGFDSVVPISIRSSLFPTNWTVYVEDESGDIIRTFTGFTADGIVETEWDGKDGNGVDAPIDHGYRVLFVLGELPPPPAPSTPPPPGPAPGPSSFSMQSPESAPKLAGHNKYGQPVYEVTTALPPIPSVYFDEKVQEEIKQGKRPPLPPLMDGTFSPDAKHPKVKKKQVSLVEASFMALQMAGDPNVHTNDVLVWREKPWTSGQIILARQRLSSLILNTKYANNLATLATDVATAEDENPGRTVYGSPMECNLPASFDVLLNDLKSPNGANVRDFYYIGHSNGDAIGYSEGSPGNGISTAKLRLALGNFVVRNSLRWNGRMLLSFRYPYRFVFIDGCLSVNGPLHSAFGIIDDKPSVLQWKPRRAFLGWTVETKNSIMNQTQADWSGLFWKKWIDNDNADYNVALLVAVNRATALKAIPVQPKIIGDISLRWSD